MGAKLTDNEGRLLLKLARQSIEQGLGRKTDIRRTGDQASRILLNESRGTFVSLHKKGELRGCIGNIEPVKTIFESVSDNAGHAAFKDSRFSPLRSEELGDVQIEVSILTRPEPLDYSDCDDLVSRLEPGVHGVIVEKRYHKATFLPQVWDQLPDPEQFLSRLCLKAGLPADEWRTGDLTVLTYQVQLFEESE